MAGNSSIQGDQVVTFTDNMSFDGTDRGGAMVADGQLWIGATASNRSNNGGHVRLGSITANDGSITVTNGPGTINLSGAAQGFQPNAVLQEFDDFISSVSSDVNGLGKLQWSRTNTRPEVRDGTADHPGIWNFTPDPGIHLVLYQAGSASMGASVVRPGGGIISCNWVIQLTGLSGAGNTYVFSCGLADVATIRASSNGFVNGCYFQYTDTVNGGSWQIKNTAALVTTTANTSTAASTAFVTLSVVINAAASSVSYYINNVQVANSPITTNIPTAAITPFFQAINTAGTTPPINVDLFWITQNLSNPRPGPLAGNITANNRFFGNYTQTATNYQVLGTDAIIGISSTAAPRTITMPAAGIIAGQWFRIKDESGGAAANNITVSGNGFLIDGAASKVINTNYGSIDIYFNGSAYYVS